MSASSSALSQTRTMAARTIASSSMCSTCRSSAHSQEQFAQGQKMQAVGQLAGGVAHDFNNVLTAIIGFSDLLLANHRPSDRSFQDIMNIKQNANRAASLVRQLLAFSRTPDPAPAGDPARRRSVGPSHAAFAAARREGRPAGRPRARPLARQGRPFAVRTGRREPCRQCPRRDARRRQADDPHVQHFRCRRGAALSTTRKCPPPTTCCWKSRTKAPA